MSASRDFTYVDDIVGGLLLILKYRPKACDEVYNLGFGRPVSVDKLVELLEDNLGKKAKKVSDSVSDSVSVIVCCR